MSHSLLDKLAPRLWRVLAWLGVGVVLVLSLIAVPKELDVSGYDKLVHMSMYATLMFCFSRGYGRRHWLGIAVALGGLGLAIEFLQSLTPYRSASLADEFANLAGISIMLLMVRRSADGDARRVSNEP